MKGSEFLKTPGLKDPGLRDRKAGRRISGDAERPAGGCAVSSLVYAPLLLAEGVIVISAFIATLPFIVILRAFSFVNGCLLGGAWRFSRWSGRRRGRK